MKVYVFKEKGTRSYWAIVPARNEAEAWKKFKPVELTWPRSDPIPPQRRIRTPKERRELFEIHKIVNSKEEFGLSVKGSVEVFN